MKFTANKFINPKNKLSLVTFLFISNRQNENRQIFFPFCKYCNHSRSLPNEGLNL